MAKDLTQLFSGIFFFISLIYFTIMFLVLKDEKYIPQVSELRGEKPNSNFTLSKEKPSLIRDKTSLDFLF